MTDASQVPIQQQATFSQCHHALPGSLDIPRHLLGTCYGLGVVQSSFDKGSLMEFSLVVNY